VSRQHRNPTKVPSDHEPDAPRQPLGANPLDRRLDRNENAYHGITLKGYYVYVLGGFCAIGVRNQETLFSSASRLSCQYFIGSVRTRPPKADFGSGVSGQT
jgi:hypothetical protein